MCDKRLKDNMKRIIRTNLFYNGVFGPQAQADCPMGSSGVATLTYLGEKLL